VVWLSVLRLCVHHRSYSTSSTVSTEIGDMLLIATYHVQSYDAGRVWRKHNVTIWSPSVCPFVCLSGRHTVFYQEQHNLVTTIQIVFFAVSIYR